MLSSGMSMNWACYKTALLPVEEREDAEGVAEAAHRGSAEGGGAGHQELEPREDVGVALLRGHANATPPPYCG